MRFRTLSWSNWARVESEYPGKRGRRFAFSMAHIVSRLLKIWNGNCDILYFAYISHFVCEWYLHLKSETSNLVIKPWNHKVGYSHFASVMGAALESSVSHFKNEENPLTPDVRWPWEGTRDIPCFPTIVWFPICSGWADLSGCSCQFLPTCNYFPALCASFKRHHRAFWSCVYLFVTNRKCKMKQSRVGMCDCDTNTNISRRVCVLFFPVDIWTDVHCKNWSYGTVLILVGLKRGNL